jgi:rubrerythrin
VESGGLSALPKFRNEGREVLHGEVRAVMSRWRCPICEFLYEGLQPPQECPSCLQPGDTFEFVDDDEAYLDEVDASNGYDQ